ncbi:quinone oxidoreductase [Microbacterium betulae]|uniref:Quinone oxidoreductase n=1 Tax=Microbacterium betulae TaxID=2981139 RepID=A0AA97FHT6_9MICO|nr:quinone oxidoreductase [Microbacterium sp. AB]WOF22834.1 quinone oxidoreductase [Microbacterium sp. AB]
MHAIVIDRFGGPEVAVWTETDRPTPAPTQVLVQVNVSGLNFMDAHQLGGGTPIQAPFVAGVEGVGVIVEVGADVSDLKVGQRVGWHSGGQGSFAEFTAVEAGRAIPIPDEVDDETATALLLQGTTAHYLATDAYAVQDGDPVIVHAAAGGVGVLLTQVAKLRGGTVIGTVSTEEKAEVARAAGADHVLFYDGFSDRARELTGGEGVAAVYDSVGADTFDGGLAALRERGRLVVYGGASGPVPPLDLSRLTFGGSLSVTSTMVVHFTRTTEELRRRAADLFAWVASGELTVNIGARYPVSEAGAAIAAIKSRNSTGKVLLTH